MNGSYEVLSPWAEADAVPLKGLSPRLSDLSGKRIGLFFNMKVSAIPMLEVVERKLKERFPEIAFSRFGRMPNLAVAETADKAKFETWVQEVDAVVFAVGD